MFPEKVRTYGLFYNSFLRTLSYHFFHSLVIFFTLSTLLSCGTNCTMEVTLLVILLFIYGYHFALIQY